MSRISDKTKDRKRELKIWLDDERKMPKGYNLHALTASEVIQLLQEQTVSLISLDQDLGADKIGYRWSEVFGQYRAVGSGFDVAKFIEKYAKDGKLEKIKWRIHSTDDTMAVDNMRQSLENANKIWNLQEK